MNNFTFYSPTYFVFGKETENEVAKYVKRFGGSNILIHYGGGSVVKSGLLDRVIKSLSEGSIEYTTLGGVQPNPRSGLVYEGIKLCKEKNIDFILAVGGGSVIDSAKAIAAGAKYEGDFWDFYEGKEIKDAIPVGTILTISAAGSEGSSGSVITHENGMLKRSAGGDVLRPVFSILNPELTTTLSAYQTACGATDIMAHVFERYFTNTKDVEITDRLCEAVLLTIIKEVPTVLLEPGNYNARANIMWAGMVAHNNICGVGRVQDWSSHKIEHELSAMYDVAHGAGLAVIFPAWMKYVMKNSVNKFAQMAVRVWGCEMDFENPEKTALEGIRRFENFLRLIGMPLTFGEIGAKESDIPELVSKLFRENDRIGSLVSLTADDVEKIYRLAL